MKNISLSLGILLLVAVFLSCTARNTPAEKPVPVESSIQQTREDLTGGWQSEWEKAIQAVKREGSLSIYTSIGANGRQAITEGFEKKYGLKVEFTPGRSADLAEKVFREERAGLKMVDIFMAGISTSLTYFKPANMVQPITPLLILPEVLDTNVYWDGKLPWRDKDKLTMAILAYPAPSLFTNTNLVKTEELTSYMDLLNPRWKGKIVMLDPLRAGSGERWVHVIGALIMNWDYIRELLKQELMIYVDQPVMAQWLVRGKYAISIGVASEHVLPLKEAGAPVRMSRPKEGAYLTSGSFGFSVMKNAPHPNSAKLFSNWALSKEGQTSFARIVQQHGVRADVPTDSLLPEFIRYPGEKHIITDDEDFNIIREQNKELVRKIFEPYWR